MRGLRICEIYAFARPTRMRRICSPSFLAACLCPYFFSRWTITASLIRL